MKRAYIGIDVGGTKMTSVLFDGKNILSDFTLATPKDDLDHFIIMLGALIDPLLEKAKTDKLKVQKIGIGIPGILENNREKILKCPNLSILDGVNLVKILKDRLGFEFAMDNDASCFLRAEVKSGAGKGLKNVFGVTLGTGIGGAWWVNGEIYNGSHCTANEIGHTIINNTEAMDLEHAYHKLTQNNPGQLAEEAYRGDVLAEKIFQEVGGLLGMSFAGIINLLDPELIIIG
ncbi:MAG: ROK family protein, partial [Patescibacteria group bacterium]